MYCMCKPNIAARSGNHCCRGKTKIITYSGYVFVALGYHAVRMRHIVICGLLSCTTCFYPPSPPQKEHNMCVLIFYTTSV